MKLHLPQLMPECLEPAKQFCNSCRHREKGRTFRKTIKKIRGFDEVVDDFECPLGLDWIEDGLSGQTTIAKKECKYCDDFDSQYYVANIQDVVLNTEKIELEFDINGFKSIVFEQIKNVNGKHQLEQGRYGCLWTKKIEKALAKYSYKEDGDSNLDILDVYIYLEKISSEKWWFSITADGGFDLFSSVVEVQKGKCIGNVVFSSVFNKENSFKDTDSVLKSQGIEDSIGKIIGHGGHIVSSCGEET